jgi:signal transduction histidine kinase
MQAFGGVLLVAAPIVLLLVAIGSWLLVGAALRPVRRLQAAAERIRRSGRPGRLPEGGGADELAHLTSTLNRFLTAQQQGLERERRMVADASHELRTPLAVLTTELELAQRHAGDAAVLEAAVVRAQGNVGALSRLATQLLELSALDAEETLPDRATVGDLVSELMAAVDRARSLAPEAVHVEFDLPDELEEGAEAPIAASAFGRVVDNLAGNALNATSAGSVELVLRQETGRLVLTVTDTGRGVPPEFLPHAFDRFARSAASRADGTPGSGIGLALVRALVEAAGGEVSLVNRLGGGAVATVVLPVAARPSSL